LKPGNERQFRRTKDGAGAQLSEACSISPLSELQNFRGITIFLDNPKAWTPGTGDLPRKLLSTRSIAPATGENP